MNLYSPKNHLPLVRLPERITTPQAALQPEDSLDFPEDNLQAIDPGDLSTDGGWWYRCRSCDLHTRVRTKAPHCRHCGFSQNTRGAR